MTSAIDRYLRDFGRFQDVTPYPPSRSYFFSINANF